MFPKEEIIHVYGYRDVWDNNYDSKHPDVMPNGDIIYCEACDLRDFFALLKNYPERKIILVSSESDYGVVYQQEYHSNRDIFKCYYRTHWDDIAENTTDYIRVVMYGAIAEKCDINDKFAVKIDGQTACTFPEIPENVTAWYIANMAINEPRCHFLPYGINSQGDLSLFEEYFNKRKEQFLAMQYEPKWYYVNFDVNTYSRYELKNYWRQYIKHNDVSTWATFIEKAKPVREFYEDIIYHLFNACPSGNGFDCFRSYESLYLGTWPVCPVNRFTINMMNAGFPIICVENMYGITLSLLKEILPKQYELLKNFNSKLLTKSHWFDRIRSGQ